MEIDKLIQLVKTLRGENGCPWDKKQTPGTMAGYLVEEAYELIDAVESGNPAKVCEELGDVLFLILFIVRLFEESGHFAMKDVVSGNYEKMVRRHPHVFSNDTVDSADEVKYKWSTIKMKEKTGGQAESILDSVPVSLPALMRAYRISERAAEAGLDWNDISGVVKKVEEEWSEFKSELTEKNRAKINRERTAREFGDILFTLVNVARFAQLDPETALRKSTKKFEKRFQYVEGMLSKKGKNLESISLSEMNSLWEKAKREIDPGGLNE